jgi:hypothetical protein
MIRDSLKWIKYIMKNIIEIYELYVYENLKLIKLVKKAFVLT